MLKEKLKQKKFHKWRFLDFVFLSTIFPIFLTKIGDFLSYSCDFCIVFLRKIGIFFSLKQNQEIAISRIFFVLTFLATSKPLML